MAKKYFRTISRKTYIALCVIFLTSCATFPSDIVEEEEPLTTFIIGVQHIGKKHTIPEFYVNGYPGGTLGEERTASAWICCIALSRRSKAVMTAKIRWDVIDWSRSPSGKVWTDYENAIYLGPYHADVPVENAEESGFLFIHFFPDGKVRAVVSNDPITNPLHPVNFDDNDGGEKATVGMRIKKIFPLDSKVPGDSENSQ